MSKHPSLVHQAVTVFREAFTPGESRHAAKQALRIDGQRANAMTPHIHSYHTLKTYQRSVIRFLKWARERYPVRDLHDLRAEMVAVYVADCRARGLAQNTICTYVTALRRFEKMAMSQLTEPLIPSDLTQTGRAFAPRGAYTSAEADTLIDTVAAQDPQIGATLAVQRAAALRLREVTHLATQNFTDAHTGEVHLGIDAAHGTVFVKGKGGLQRQVTLTKPELLEHLDPDQARPLQRGKLAAYQARTRQLVRAACHAHGIEPRGTHGLRATGATEFLAAQRDAGVPVPQARRDTAQRLGHRRVSILRHYTGE